MEVCVTQNVLQNYNKKDLKKIYKEKKQLYKMTFIVGHNNKCHVYRSVGGSAIYIIML